MSPSSIAFPLVAGVLVAKLAFGDPTALPLDRGAAGLERALKQLSTTASVLHVVAHPDDEDGPLLTYLARGRGVRTMALSLTRGEGGANLIAPYFFDELGVLRTLEYLEANRYYGVEQFFTRAADYGYSKQLSEAQRKWKGSEILLEDMVRVIRRERPDVVISRFWGGRRDGHGHHTLAGVLTPEACAAAADPERFPDQLREGLFPWRVKKLYRGNIRPERRAEDAEAWTVKVDAGEYDPLLGASYYQIARRGYGFHRSQGILHHDGRAGSRVSHYQLIPADSDERVVEESLFDGLDTTLRGLTEYWSGETPAWLVDGLDRTADWIASARSEFRADDPPRIVPPLANALRSVRSLSSQLFDTSSGTPESHREIARHLARKEHELERALSLALGIDLEAAAGRDSLTGSSPFSRSSTFAHATPGQMFDVGVRLVHRSRVPVEFLKATLSLPPGWSSMLRDATPPDSNLAYNGEARAKFSVAVPSAASPTRPYWRRASISDAFYDVVDSLATLPFAPPPASCRATIRVAGVEVSVDTPVRLVLRDPGLGTRYPPLAVAPPVSVRFAEGAGILPRGRTRYELTVTVRGDVAGGASGDVRLQVPAGWSVEPASAPFRFDREGAESTLRFTLSAPTEPAGERYEIRAIARHADREYSEGYRTIEARDVGRYDYYLPAIHRVRVVDVNLANDLAIAYVTGSGDDIPQSLRFLGIAPTLLDSETLQSGDLDRFDAIVVGVRAYAVREDVRRVNSRLLGYVERGGVLVVQYQTPEFDRNFGPYPYSMGRAEEVSEEDAAVRILAPEHPLFTQPNAIAAADFDDWVEQRGSKFWATWDERYTPLLECHDEDQEPQRGGMLYARSGKGAYIYSAYAWYRQLPAGVPGAFRIYANLLSHRRTLESR